MTPIPSARRRQRRRAGPQLVHWSGAERVARLVINLTRRLAPNTRAETVLVNTNLGLLLRTNGRPDLVLAFEFDVP